MKHLFLIIFLVSSCQFVLAQSAHKALRQGNSAYKQDDFGAAAESYYKALEADPSNVKGKYNLGNATYQSEGYDEAIQHYSSAAQLAKDNQIKADAFHNLGNAWFQKAKAQNGEGLDKSVEAYKNSLRLNPQDQDTKKNLALTQRLLQRLEQQQQQQQQQQDDQQEQQQQEEQQDEQQQQSQSQQQEEQQQQQPQEEQQAKDLNKEEALELLKIMDDEEKKVQEKLRKAKGNGKKPDKDW